MVMVITETIIITIVKAVVLPAMGLIIGTLVHMTKKLIRRVERLEDKHAELDKDLAVQGSKLNNIQTSVHQINRKLDKIIDKLVA